MRSYNKAIQFKKYSSKYTTYMISSKGHVYKNGKDITSTLSQCAGYLVLDGEHLHKIMMLLFNYDKDKLNDRNYVINHRDMNRYNNSITNLEYATRSENALKHLPTKLVNDIPDDIFYIKSISGNVLKNPLIYSPSANIFYRRYREQYRVIEPVLSYNLHYIDVKDSGKRYRFTCDSIDGYKRPQPKINKTTKTYTYVTTSGETKTYTYEATEKTEREKKINCLKEFIKYNSAALKSLKTLTAKTNFINSNIPNYRFSSSTIYKYIY